MFARAPLALTVIASTVLVAACERGSDPTGPAPFPPEAEVFSDGFGASVDFQAFEGSKLDAVSIDATERRNGEASLRVDVPAPGNPNEGFAGGAFVAGVPRDLTGFNALTFWAKSSVSISLNAAGLGNDNTGTSLYMAEVDGGLALTSTWAKYTLPIPDASALQQEAGLFFFAENAEGTEAYNIWFDDIQFESLETLVNPRAYIAETTVEGAVGAMFPVPGTQFVANADGVDVVMDASPAYFDFASSDPAVATVDDEGTVSLVGPGTASITAQLASVAAEGTVTLQVNAPPAEAAPAPTQDEADVISLFSNAFSNVTVDSWLQFGNDGVSVADGTVLGDDVKIYSDLVFAGVEFSSSTIDASNMTRFRMDIWTPDATEAPAVFRVKLVDFGADDAFGGGDDSEHEVTFSATTTPALATESWISLDVPLADFAGLLSTANIAQLVISGDPNTVYVDNLFFYDDGMAPPPPATEPTAAAPTPTESEADVISLYSNAYTNVAVNTWRTDWSSSALADVQVAGDDAKKYSSLDFNGIEFTGANSIDASGMTNLRMDIWSPNASQFGIKLVDWGADNAFGGGDDTEQQLDFNSGTTPALTTGEWVTLDIPLANFTGLTSRMNLSQMIIVGQPTGSATVWVDNIYFYNDAAAPATEPTAAAPTPTESEADVISLYSNAYTNVAVNTWRTDWSSSALADVQVAGDDAKKYSSLDFNGIEFTGANSIDASGMTNLRMDIWSPNASQFGIKLVDWGADNAFGGGDDTEQQLDFNSGTTPALTTGEWVTLDIPLANFTGLTSRMNLSQMIIVGQPTGSATVWVDNVYFRK